MIPAVIILVLVLVNGLFVAAEFSIVGSSPVRVENLADKGNRRARYIARIVRSNVKRDRFIATAQLGITAASLGLGMYGEHVLAEWLAGHLEVLGVGRWIAAHTIASVVAVTVLTYLHIVVGEMIPKSLALQGPVRTVLAIAPVMRVVQIVVYPLVIVLNGLGNAILRLAGMRRTTAGAEHLRSPEELAYIIRESQAGGLLRKESARVVQELLEFGDLTAVEVMVPRVQVRGIPLGARRDAVLTVVRGAPHTRYPVYRESLDDILGTVHVKDLLEWQEANASLDARFLRRVPFVPESATVDHILTVMHQSRSHMVVVMDEHGGTAGVVTIEDLFEEVVGDITEDAGETPPIRRDAAGRLRVAGLVRIEDVGNALGVVLEHDEVDTVSGLVLALLGRPPELGDVVEYDDVRFEVSRIEGHGVAECVVTALEPPLGEVTERSG